MRANGSECRLQHGTSTKSPEKQTESNYHIIYLRKENGVSTWKTNFHAAIEYYLTVIYGKSIHRGRGTAVKYV